MDMPLMALLHEEHRTIAAVCDAIERSLPGLEADDEHAVDLVRLALEYMRDFPEWHHHPREEHLFTLALDKDPLLERILDVVRAEHDSLPGDTQALLDFLAKPRDHHMNTRAVSALRLYLVEQRKHIAREDRDIFPRLPGLLAPSAWALPPISAEAPADPLRSKSDPGRFKPLLDAISALARP